MNSKKQAPEAKTYAKDKNCCKCGKQAVAFFPACDPDIESEPYCRKCLDAVKLELSMEIAKINEKPKQEQEENCPQGGIRTVKSDGVSRPASGADKNYGYEKCICGHTRFDHHALASNGRECDECECLRFQPAPQPSENSNAKTALSKCSISETSVLTEEELKTLSEFSGIPIHQIKYLADLLLEKCRTEMDALRKDLDTALMEKQTFEGFTTDQTRWLTQKDTRIRELERLKPNPAHVLVLLNTAERLMTLQEIKEQLGLSERDAHVFTDTLMDARLIDAKYEVVNGKQTYRFFSKEGILLENAKEKARVEK